MGYPDIPLSPILDPLYSIILCFGPSIFHYPAFLIPYIILYFHKFGTMWCKLPLFKTFMVKFIFKSTVDAYKLLFWLYRHI